MKYESLLINIDNININDKIELEDLLAQLEEATRNYEEKKW